MAVTHQNGASATSTTASVAVAVPVHSIQTSLDGDVFDEDNEFSTSPDTVASFWQHRSNDKLGWHENGSLDHDEDVDAQRTSEGQLPPMAPLHCQRA